MTPITPGIQKMCELFQWTYTVVQPRHNMTTKIQLIHSQTQFLHPHQLRKVMYCTQVTPVPPHVHHEP